MNDVLKRVNKGYYEKQFSNHRNNAPYVTQLGIELLALVKKQAKERHELEDEIEGLEQENDELKGAVDYWKGMAKHIEQQNK